ERPARPTAIAAGLEDVARLLAALQRIPQLTRHGIGLSQTRLGERADLVEAGAIGDAGGLAAMFDGDLGTRAGEAMKEPGPVVPDRPPVRVHDTVHDVANTLQGLNMLGMAAEGGRG